MPQFLTGKDLDSKLTDIIWKARKSLIIFSPFIRLDKHCREVFDKLKKRPELEVILIFGKNEEAAHRSLPPEDLQLFKELSNVVIIYCKNLHAKHYANEQEALLTSLNLLGKSMTDNVEFGICFQQSLLPTDKLYQDAIKHTDEVIYSNPCVYVKRPKYRKALLGLSKSYLESEILIDQTEALYRSKSVAHKLYSDFEDVIWESDQKPTRQGLVKESKPERYERPQRKQVWGFCIRTGVQIPYDPTHPMCKEAYRKWAVYKNSNFRENFCHKTGKPSNGRTSMANPEL